MKYCKSDDLKLSQYRVDIRNNLSLKEIVDILTNSSFGNRLEERKKKEEERRRTPPKKREIKSKNKSEEGKERQL